MTLLQGGAPNISGRLLIVLPQPFLEDRGTSIATHHLLRAYTSLGYEVDVMCFAPGRDPAVPGTRIIRSPNPFGFQHVPIGLSLRKAILDLFLVGAVRRQLRREIYVCVHAVEEAAFIAALVGRGRGVPLIYDMASSLPEHLLQYRFFRNRLSQRVLRLLERRLLTRVDLVVCSAGLERKVRSAAPDTPLAVWLFPTEFEPPSEEAVARLREKLGIEATAHVVLYLGSFAKYQGLSVLLDAIPNVLTRVPEARFVIVGASSEKEFASVRESIPGRFVNNVRILRRIPRSKTPLYLALADVLVSLRIQGSNLPLKAFDYLSCGKPIIATDVPAHRLLRHEGLAVLADPTGERFAHAIIRVLSSEKLAEELGVRARAYAESQLSWTSFVKSVEEMTKRVRPASAE